QGRKKIIYWFTESKYVCFIFVSTLKVSQENQLSDNVVTAAKSSLSFIESRSKTGNTIRTGFESSKDGIQLDSCRCKAFNNATVLVGYRSGVQRRTHLRNQPKIYICAIHCPSLCLACVHVASARIHSVTLLVFLHSNFAGMFCFNSAV
ncbi:unnamed protein product, partial [Dicrocoelium dendriticum]